MCAIGGLVNFNRNISDRDFLNIKAWNTTLKHRGPDQQGSYLHNNVAFINNRLSIMDLSSKADLPIQSKDKYICIAYNGEISNFIELTDKFNLTNKLRSKSDSEVILELYQKIGLKFLNHVTGMFSLAIHDKKINKVFLIRDFYGIIPLFIYQNKECIYFSSEIKALIELPGFETKLNNSAFNHYFSLAYIPGEMTPYQNIKEIDKATILTVDLNTNSTKKDKYYQLNYTINHDISEKIAVEGAYDLLRDSVRRNLMSDAPIGTTLSGGLDTSSIVGLAKEMNLSKNLKTYSIKMKDSSFDESKYQRLMAEFAQTDHHEITVDARDTMNALYSSIAHLDEPCADGAVVPFFLLAQKASQKVKVLLSGEGGDEVFNAYETHGAYKYRNIYRQLTPKFIRLLFSELIERLPVQHKKLSLEFKLKRFLQGCELNTSESHIYWRHPFTNNDKQLIFKNQIDEQLTDKLFKQSYDSIQTKNNFNRISYLDLEHFFYGDLMLKSDRMFMAHSIEMRFPFMDRPLVDFMTTVPPQIRVKGFNRRYIQKQAMRNTLPKAIYRRNNFGLEIPNSKWANNELQPLIKKYLNPEMLGKSGLLNVDNIVQLLDQHFYKKRDLGRGIWSLINFQIWFEIFIDKKNYKEYLVQ